MVYAEFFEQGDLERKMGRRPIEPMDKERASIPALQVSFLAEIIIPTFTLLERIIPECASLTESARLNMTAWGNAKCTNLFPPYTN